MEISTLTIGLVEAGLVAAGFVAGGLLVALVLKLRHGEHRSSLDTELATARALLEERNFQIKQLGEGSDQRDGELAQMRNELKSVDAERIRLDTIYKAELANSEAQKEVLAQAEKKLREAFTALSADALRKNNESFLELAKTSLEKFHEGATSDLEKRQTAIDEMVKPIRESLEKVDSKIGEIEKQRVGAYEQISEQVKMMTEGHQKLQLETGNLVKALRAPQVRGRWGEIQLRNVVEMAGMVDHCDFIEQKSVDSDEGLLRPDMMVMLPGGKRVVVDAKAPLQAYLDATEASDDKERERHLKRHAQQVRDHMRKLGAKSYWSQFDSAPEFVVMFLPGEMFFSAALEQDRELIEFGTEEKVIVASPTTLIALLRAVSYGWRQERLAENAQKISVLGRELYDRIGVMAGHVDKVGRSLKSTVSAYNSVVGSMETRVLASARRFKELGASSEDLPQVESLEQTPREITAPELNGGESNPDED